MPSQFPEHALVILLRQCFTTPRCQALRCWRQTLPQSSTRPHHTSPAHRRLTPKLMAIGRQQRYYGAHDGQSDNEIRSLGRTNSSRFSSMELQEFGSSVQLEQHGNGGGQQPQESNRIAILGGGITGLASAHYLAKELPNAKIAVYEGSDRLGGWLHSKQVDVGNGTVLFEQGPRTLRPNTPAATTTLEIIKDLGLEDELLITSKHSIAAQNRFVYYPDHLVRMPGPGQDLYSTLWSLFTEPVYKGLLMGAAFEYSRPPRPETLDDESVGSFLNRRLGSPDPGNNIVSAVLHGIYAGDIYQLSMKSLAPKFWYNEAVYGGLSKAIFQSMSSRTNSMLQKDVVLQQEIAPKLKGPLMNAMGPASVYTFREGIGALSAALEESLRANPNVELRLNQKVSKIEHDGESDGIKITTANNQPPKIYVQAISTISGHALSTLSPGHLPSLAAIHAVTVMVVNLYYTDPNLLPERGFGYLIPQSISFDRNPECALGVVFDSDATIGQDSVSGTKLTVMFGGHWWDGFGSYPDEEEGLAMAKAVLRRHLNVDVEPTAVNVGLQRECIPQYTVGHEARMKSAHEELMSTFNGKLKVAGNSYTGVGLNDCVRAARDVVMGMNDGRAKTGLEEFVYPRGWVETKIPSRAEIEQELERRYGGKPPGS